MQEFTLHRNSIPRRPLLPPQRKLNMQLHAKLESRKKKLQLGLEDAVREKIRMPARDLKTTLAHSSKILEHFYPHHVTNRQGLSLDEFFERWVEEFVSRGQWTGAVSLRLAMVNVADPLTFHRRADATWRRTTGRASRVEFTRRFSRRVSSLLWSRRTAASGSKCNTLTSQNTPP